jgi:uncharacterized protein (DUF2141 family)
MFPRVARAVTVGAAALVLAPIALSQTAPPSLGRLTAAINGLRNDNGVVRVGLYDTPSRFPRANQNSRACVASIHARRASCDLENITPGVYAIAFTHDENNNGHFDQGFLGWPLEGYGFSNNAHPHLLGAPSWNSARFTYAGGAVLTVAMTAQY